MEHLDSKPDLFKKVEDPYKHGRICYSFRMLHEDDLWHITRDHNFAFIADGLIVFTP